MKKLNWLLLLLTITMISCGDNDEKKEDDPTDENAVLKTAVLENYADIAYENYLDAYNEAENLNTAIKTFLADPTSTTKFEATKKAWRAAREPYGQSEAFRFANGPIDDENGPEGWLNAWPLDEVYIDYVRDNATSGIINDSINYPNITKELLVDLNEKGGDANISIGYHAIEFLLWGQDAITPTNEISAGTRPNTDYVVGAGGTANNQARRAAYLQACADLLVDHLKLVVDAWSPSRSSNYRSSFLAMDSDKNLANILTSIGVLSKAELAGERVITAYTNESQEDEHSCFSDNTHRDLRLNAQGCANVYLGTYTTVGGNVISGSSIADLVKKVDAAQAEAVQKKLDLALTDVESTGIPFDYAISQASGQRQGIFAAAVALQNLGDEFAKAGEVLGLTVTADFDE